MFNSDISNEIFEAQMRCFYIALLEGHITSEAMEFVKTLDIKKGFQMNGIYLILIEQCGCTGYGAGLILNRMGIELGALLRDLDNEFVCNTN